MVCRRLLQAVSGPYRYAETVVEAECVGHNFSAKGRETLDKGWKIYAEDVGETLLPKGLREGQRMPADMAAVKEGQTSPPTRYTEGTLLAAMETAGAKDMPEDAERRGPGAPATRAAILEKLVSSGFIERKKSQKIAHFIPTPVGTALVAVLPETLQSPMLTAEWERRLKEVERGELAPDSFTDGIAALVRELTETYQTVPGAETLFPSEKKSVGKCPRCGADVNESKRGYFCESRACRFALWKESRFFAAKKKTLTKSVAAALLKNGRVKLTNCYSEKTGKTYDATVFLEDDGKKTNFRLEFENRRAHTGGTAAP